MSVLTGSIPMSFVAGAVATPAVGHTIARMVIEDAPLETLWQLSGGLGASAGAVAGFYAASSTPFFRELESPYLRYAPIVIGGVAVPTFFSGNLNIVGAAGALALPLILMKMYY